MTILQTNFIFDKFGKTPQISEVSDMGILPEKEKEFYQIYRSGRNDLLQDKSNFSEKSIHESPDIRQLYRIIKLLSNNSYDSYKSLLAIQQQSIIPTGTCFPFDRKIYLTLDGGILPHKKNNGRTFVFSKKGHIFAPANDKVSGLAMRK